MTSLFERMHSRRISRIIDESSVGHMERPWAKRTAVVLAMASGLGFLLTLYPINELDPSFDNRGPLIHWSSVICMVIAFALLRRSVYRVNALSGGQVSESQVANRDWAYQLGNLAIRVLLLTLFGIGIVYSLVIFLGHNLTVTEVSPQLSTTAFQASAASVSEFIRYYFTRDAILATLQLIGFLTFVAYVLPMTLFAWKDANSVNLERLHKVEVQNLEGIARSVSRRYFIRLKIFGLLVLATIVLWAPLSRVSFPLNSGAMFYLLLGTVGYGVWVFGFGMLNQVFVIQVLQRSKLETSISLTTNQLVREFQTMSITGSAMLILTLLIPFSVSGPGVLFMFLVFGGGIMLLSIHMGSFEAIKKIGRLPSKDED